MYSKLIQMTHSSFLKKLHSEEYYMSEDGYVVFTEKYHLKRGYCCNSNCKHCPYIKKKI
tara:strand:+ start:146 stop:322 length:177 start_codon:yes stop_codon:yes gene_type:complete